MTTRNDATNYMTLDFPYEKINSYIANKKEEGYSFTMMTCIMASMIRAISQYPEINRFVVAKKIYARSDIVISFVTLKEDWDGKSERDETVVKLEFTGSETIYEISDILNTAIEENRKAEKENSADKLLAGIFKIPVIPSAIVSLLKCMDKFGLLPKSMIKASPFHSSVFFTNMASLRSYPVYHHIYNFGTTGAFLSLGTNLSKKGEYSLKISSDERMCNGSTMIRAMRYFLKMARHPELLEVPPEEVREDLP